MTHAKAIFFGEHAVVYGHEGITIPLPEMKIDVTLENTNEIQHRDDILAFYTSWQRIRLISCS